MLNKSFSINISSQIEPYNKTINVDSDKSISIRSFLIGAVSHNISEVKNVLESEDVFSCINCLRKLGVKIQKIKPRHYLVYGKGLGSFYATKNTVLDCGNSGTGMRLLAGVLAAQKFDSVLTGDESLSSRPMGRIMKPLEEMGAKFEAKGAKPGCAPLHITGSELNSIYYEMPMASAQVKSAVLLAGLFAPEKTTVVQPAVTRDHSERLLNAFGVTVTTKDNVISLYGKQRIRSCDVVVPGDISSAAFWIVAAACRPGSKLLITNVGLNPTRTGLIDVLIRMGAHIKDIVLHDEGGEPRGNVEVVGQELHGVEIRPEEVPNIIDEVPILAVAGALAKGKMTIRNASELRVKETDRIETTITNLRAMDAQVEEFEDGMVIQGETKLKGAHLKSFGDHRIAMAFSMAGLLADSGNTMIDDCACVNTSYPGFANHLKEMRKR